VTAVVDRAAQRALVERYARERPRSVLFDPTGPALLDVASGKTLPLDFGAVSSVEERTDADTGRPYLAVALGGEREIAIADQGIVFPPVTRATGPLEGLPRAVCFGDLAAAESRLAHFLLAHPDEPPDRAHVALFLFLLAAVDGARAAGFDVSAEERRLERILGELEARRRG
jgi:hypothetical protein